MLAALTFLGGVFCLFFGAARKQGGVSSTAVKTTIGLAVFTLIALASVGYDWYRFDVVERIVITTNAVPRKGNSEQYEPAFVSSIPFGTVAVALDERNGWYLLRFPNGQEGWLPYSQTFRLRQ